MGRVFGKASEAVKHTDFANKTFQDILDAAKEHVDDLTWEELAQYNWGTREARAVNRALMENIGCKSFDKDVLGTAFDTTRGPGGTPEVLLPKLYEVELAEAKDPLEPTFERKLPPPAVSIDKLDRWFLPPAACTLEYSVEGLSSQADKVDIEVHVDQYFSEDAQGARTKTTTTADPDSTHIHRKTKHLELPQDPPEAPTAAQTYAAWKGESCATQGVLQNTSISHACAPYTVLLRFYKDDADAKARLVLKRFFPHWKLPTAANQPMELDEASLVVGWDFKDDNGKLKAGQLIVYDKGDTEVFRAALNEQALQKKAYDLVNDAPKQWGKTNIKRDRAPYRVQLQVHSLDEENGLALAAMHTAVKALVYSKAQLISLNIKPGTKNGGADYLGENLDDDDKATRIAVMKQAIQTAKTNADLAEDTLKVFMAPEFYFRGAHGGYPMVGNQKNDPGLAPGILKELRKETDKPDYADWLFVFGTIIGYLKHSDSGNPTTYSGDNKHNVKILEVGGKTGTMLRLQSNAVGALRDSMKLGVVWKLKQDATELEITKCTFENICTGWVAVKGQDSVAFANGPVVLVDSTTAEHNAQIVEIGGDKTTMLRINGVCAQQIRDDYKQGKVWKVKTASGALEVTRNTWESEDKCWLTVKQPESAFKVGEAQLLEPVAWVTDVTNTTVDVWSRLCVRIPHTIAPAHFPWKVKQGTENEVVAFSKKTAHHHTLTLKSNVTFAKDRACELIEPKATEVFNMALVQKGWPAPWPDDKALKSGVIYKEYVSWIDFLGANYAQPPFYNPDGSGHLIKIDGGNSELVLPTSGSVDLLGENPNIGNVGTWTDPQGTVHQVGSEINKSGIGGGSVLTIDGVTLGVEVCLDHAKNKLPGFYQNAAQAGDPRVQMLLIPSWGMSIGGGPIECLPNGLLFNVDGARCNSVARLHDQRYACDTHKNVSSPGPALCPQCTLYPHWCSMCLQPFWDSTLNALHLNCGNPGSHAPFCTTCKRYFPYTFTNCNLCSGVLLRQDTSRAAMRPLGMPLTTTATPAVNVSGVPHFTDTFEQIAPMDIYEVKDLPPPNVK